MIYLFRLHFLSFSFFLKKKKSFWPKVEKENNQFHDLKLIHTKLTARLFTYIKPTLSTFISVRSNGQTNFSLKKKAKVQVNKKAMLQN